VDSTIGMQILQTFVASLALAACALLLLRLALPARRRVRFDAAFRGAWRVLQGSGRAR
jgi:hypothetical protein